MADTLENPMHVEVISPDGPIFTQDGVDLVVARAEDGEFGISATFPLLLLSKCAACA